MRLLLRNLGLRILRALGTTIVDQRTGEKLGRAFFFPWKGRIVVVGLESDAPVRPQFLPQKRLTFWKQEIGFTTFPVPDFQKVKPHDTECPTDSSGPR
jgi:hypothetical protein